MHLIAGCCGNRDPPAHTACDDALAGGVRVGGVLGGPGRLMQH